MQFPESALVVGVGAQGLLMTLVLVDRGVTVHVTDINPDRVTFAERLGALAMPEGSDRLFPLVVDTVGAPASMMTALEHLEVGGSILVLGLDSRPLQLTAQALVRRQATIRGSLTYDHPGDFESTVALVANGHIRPGRIVTDEYALEDAQTAFERSGTARGKTWIRIAAGRTKS